MRYVKAFLFLIALALVCSATYGQQTTYMGGVTTTVVNRGAFSSDSLLVIPSADTSNRFSSYRKKGRITVNTDNNLYYNDGTLYKKIFTASDTVSVLATKSALDSAVNGKVSYTDTAVMLSSYLRAIDTTNKWLHGHDTVSLSNRIDKKIDYADTVNTISTKNYSDSLHRANQAGTIFRDNFYRTSLGSYYTSVTPQATIDMSSGTHMDVSVSGITTFNNYIYRNYYLAANNVRTDVKFMSTQTSTSYGIGIGFKSINSGSLRDVVAQFWTSTAPSGVAGRVSLYAKLSSGINSACILTSSTPLTWSATDTLLGIVIRKDTLIKAYFINVTTSDTVYTTYSYNISSPTYSSCAQMPQSYFPALYILGGTQSIYEWETYSLENMSVDCYDGTSIEVAGYSAGSFHAKGTDLIYKGDRSQYALFDGSGATSADMVKSQVNILIHHPRNIFLAPAANDVNQSIAVATFAANVDSMVRFWEANGYDSGVLIAATPQNAHSAVTYNDSLQAIATRYGWFYVDVFTPLKDVGTGLNAIYDSGDGIHPNAAGNLIWANIVYRYSNKPHRPTDVTNIIASSPLNATGIGTVYLSIPQASTSSSGYILSGAQTLGAPKTFSSTDATSGASGVVSTNTNNGAYSSNFVLNNTGTANEYIDYRINNTNKALIGWIQSSNTLGLINSVYSNNNYAFGISSAGSFIFQDAANGNLALLVTKAGKLSIPSGTNKAQGKATLSSGTVTVNTTAVTANSIIYLTKQDNSSTGDVRVSAISAGTSFTISSTDGADASVVGWLIIDTQ